MSSPELVHSLVRRYGWILPDRPPYSRGFVNTLRWRLCALAMRVDVAIRRGLGW